MISMLLSVSRTRRRVKLKTTVALASVVIHFKFLVDGQHDVACLRNMLFEVTIQLCKQHTCNNTYPVGNDVPDSNMYLLVRTSTYSILQYLLGYVQ